MNYVELSHAGIKGMRWGVRRFQNRDGTLTPAGKKRYESELKKLRYEQQVLKNKKATQSKLDKLNEMKKKIDEEKGIVAPKKASTSQEAPVKRNIKDIPDDELKRIVNRIQMEQQYANLNPKQVSPGKKFVNGMIEKAVIPAVQEVSKNAIKSILESAVKSAANDKK